MPHYQRNIRFILFIILPIIGFLFGWILSQKSAIIAPPPSFKIETEPEATIKQSAVEKASNFFRKKEPKNVDLDIFWETWNAMEANYLHQDDLKTKEQVYGATKGLIKSLNDPYTVFMSPKETQEFDESINGEFEGIGAEISIKDEQLIIVAPLKGSPAEKSGLKAGDLIYKIDDETCFGMSIEEAVMKIRGPKGEKVMLTVLRKDLKKPIEIVIVRDNIVLHSVEWEKKDDVAVITVSQFGTSVVKEFHEAVEAILLESPRGIVVDLRNNGGGLLDACISVLSEFLSEKIVVKTKGRTFVDTGDLMSGRDGSFVKMPLIVLTNQGSASASEIFAGAIQDHNRGLVLGDTTFGKGSVQNVIPLSDGSSLKVTIAEWLTPNGRSIHEKGIDPDEFVEVTGNEEVDPVLSRALDLVGTDEMSSILASERAWMKKDDKLLEEKTLADKNEADGETQKNEDDNLDETPANE